MATTAAQVLVKFDGDSDGLKSATGAVKGDLDGVAAKGDATSKKIKRGFTLLGKAVAAGVAAATVAIAKVLYESIKQFAQYEQNLGGVTAVFGDHAKKVAATAEDSYKNMGLSASDYMATANKMGSLFQGSGLTQKKALDLTSKAMQRAADVASVMGVDTKFAMESITGAAKGNFTMMDNLGVAMNATSIEAYALEKGVNFKWSTATQAEKSELAMRMFFDRTQQYAGNFAKESNDTISGSLGMFKASYQDFQTALASGDKTMMNSASKNLADSAGAVVKNVLPVIDTVLTSIGAALPGLLDTVGRYLPDILKTVAGGLAKVLPALAVAISAAIPDMVPILVPPLITAFSALFTALIPELPGILSAIATAIPKVLGEVIKNGDGGALAAGLGVLFAVKVGPKLAGKIASGGFSKRIGGALGGVIGKAAPAVSKATSGLGSAISTGFKGLVSGLGAVGTTILANIPGLIALGVALMALGVVIGVFWATAGTAIKELVTLLVNQIIKLLPPLATFLVSVLVPVIGALAKAIIALARGAIIPLAKALGGTLLAGVKIVTGAITKIASIFSGTFLAALKIITGAITTLARIFGGTLIGSINAARGVVVAIGGAFDRMGSAGVRVLNAVSRAANATASAVERIVDAVIRLINRLGKIKFPKLGFSGGGLAFAEGGLVPGYASGGRVTGRGTSTSDSIPARLSAGEFVMRASAVKRIGLANLTALNEGSGGQRPIDITVNAPQNADPLALSQQIGARVRFA